MYIPIHLFILAFLCGYGIDLQCVKLLIDSIVMQCQYYRRKNWKWQNFSAIKEMLDFKRKFPDGIIVSNIVSSLVNEPLTLDSFYKVYDVPVLIVVDEANSAYGAKLKSDVPDVLKKTLMQIRKGIGKRVLLLTQDYSLLDTNFRKLAHYVYESKTYMGRLTAYRRFEQQTYETHYQAGGVSYDKQGFTMATTDKESEKTYDYKAIADVDWYKTGESA